MSKLYKKNVSGGADLYFRKLFSIGWLNEWVDDEIEMLHKSLKVTAQKDPNLMVFCLSDYTLKPEGVCAPDRYKKEIVSLFSALGLNFSPDDIKAKREGKSITLFIRTGKASAEWSFEQEDDWMHDDLIDFLNDEVLPLYKEKRVIHPLPPAEADVELVFHYPDTIEKAYEEGLIPDDDFFI